MIFIIHLKASQGQIRLGIIFNNAELVYVAKHWKPTKYVPFIDINLLKSSRTFIFLPTPSPCNMERSINLHFTFKCLRIIIQIESPLFWFQDRDISPRQISLKLNRLKTFPTSLNGLPSLYLLLPPPASQKLRQRVNFSKACFLSALRCKLQHEMGKKLFTNWWKKFFENLCNNKKKAPFVKSFVKAECFQEILRIDEASMKRKNLQNSGPLNKPNITRAQIPQKSFQIL